MNFIVLSEKSVRSKLFFLYMYALTRLFDKIKVLLLTKKVKLKDLNNDFSYKHNFGL